MNTMDDQDNQSNQVEEPSVLDYFRDLLSGKRTAQIRLKPASDRAISPDLSIVSKALPWRSLGALLLALVAQSSFEPSPEREWHIGLVLYLFASILLIWAFLKSEWTPVAPPEELHLPDPGKINTYFLLLAGAFFILGFLAFGGNRFNTTNVILWLFAIACIVRAFWIVSPGSINRIVVQNFFKQPEWMLRIGWEHILFALVMGIAIIFRASMMNAIPPEMISDHAEKLYDVSDVLRGETGIFFPRNSGREAFQMYLIAVTSKLFGTGISFLSMKIGTIICGLLTLPYIYLLGKEIGNRQVGLYAMAFAGIAYWPNVLSRLALRITLYPMFVAITLFYFIRGLRTSNRKDFILAGLALGIGLHTYTAVRILPFVIVLGFALFFINKKFAGSAKTTLFRLLIVAAVALVVFLPLLRFTFDNPEAILYRSLTRVGDLERALPAPAWQIFLQNLWNALIMFGWDNGEVWTVSLPHRPALDIISSALFHLGLVILGIRLMIRRHWVDLFLLLSIPILMLPSIMALAFPAENPSTSRAGGALVPAFIIVGVALESLLRTGNGINFGSTRRVATAGIAVLLFGLASLQNYDLVFHQYYQLFKRSSWNSSEMGRVIQGYANSVGSPETAWLMAYPHWVDARLVAINAGYPTLDIAMTSENLELTKLDQRAKLFLVKPEDVEGLTALQDFYPQGTLQIYDLQVEDHDFMMYFVPPAGGQ